MLVLTRRRDQKVLFPSLGISVEVVEVSGKSVRLGIDAPREIRIIRSELKGNQPRQDIAEQAWATFPPQSDVQRNLDAANLAIHLAQNQLRQGLTEHADEALQQALACLQSLDTSWSDRPEDKDKMELSVRESGCGYRAKSRKALLFNGDSDQRKRVQEKLSDKGLDVTVLADGSRAINFLLNSSQPDLMVMLARESETGPEKASDCQLELPSIAGLQLQEQLVPIAGQPTYVWTSTQCGDFELACD